MTLADILTAALREFGALVGKPHERASIVAEAIDGGLDPSEVDLVVGALRRRCGAAPEVAGGWLLRGLSGPDEWADLVECARTWERARGQGSPIPSHYCASDPPTGLCAHGKRGSEWCDECSDLEPAPSKAKRKRAKGTA